MKTPLALVIGFAMGAVSLFLISAAIPDKPKPSEDYWPHPDSEVVVMTHELVFGLLDGYRAKLDSLGIDQGGITPNYEQTIDCAPFLSDALGILYLIANELQNSERYYSDSVGVNSTFDALVIPCCECASRDPRDSRHMQKVRVR